MVFGRHASTLQRAKMEIVEEISSPFLLLNEIWLEFNFLECWIKSNCHYLSQGHHTFTSGMQSIESIVCNCVHQAGKRSMTCNTIASSLLDFLYQFWLILSFLDRFWQTKFEYNDSCKLGTCWKHGQQIFEARHTGLSVFYGLIAVSFMMPSFLFRSLMHVFAYHVQA